ncbi:MAG: hypothetical protein QNK37_02610 [Acidobacteriota bacterium]|nr:hypothetical protein [Acidobacteriota bacterium]
MKTNVSAFKVSNAPRQLPALISSLLAFGLLVSAPYASAQPKCTTCGGKDPNAPHRKHVETIKDPNGNKSVEVYCVDDLYFKGEVICDGKPICIAKCVFDSAGNADFPIPGPNGGPWEKYVWYNWNKDTCNVTWRDTARRGGETPAEREARIIKLLIDRGCDFNCYSWTAPGNSPKKESGLQFIAYRDGGLVEETTIPESDIEAAFEGGNPYLELDPLMYADDAVGQSRIPNSVFVDTFEDGILGDRYSTLPGSTGPVQVVNGALNFDIVEHGDGFQIDMSDVAHPACIMLGEMDMTPFLIGNGFGIELLFDTGDSADIQVYQDNSVVVKIVEKNSNGTETKLYRKVEGIDADDIASIQIDWVPSDTALDRIEIEIVTKAGKKITTKVRSGLRHDEGRTVAYRMRGLDISKDPTVNIGSIVFSEQHFDHVEGFYTHLEVDNILIDALPDTVPVGQMNITAFAENFLGGIPERQLVFEVVEGKAEFTNEFAMTSLDGRETTLLTDRQGMTTAHLNIMEPGMVVIRVGIDDTDLYRKCSILATEAEIQDLKDLR